LNEQPAVVHRDQRGCVRSQLRIHPVLPQLTRLVEMSVGIDPPGNFPRHLHKLQCGAVAPNIGTWKYIDRQRRLSAFSNQGLTTVVAKDGSTSLLHRGDSSIPRAVKSEGWVHVGDPDSCQGYIFDPYQGLATSKMFRVTTPAGGSYEYVHTLVGDELMNNSYAAVSPDGQWLISGEWGDMTRLLMFPAPILNPSTPKTGGALDLAAMITLDHKVRNVQGAVFFDDTRLLCSSNDLESDLWPTPRQLLQIDLSGPLTGAATTASVTYLGPLPTESLCPGTFEVEGLDYDRAGGDLRVNVVPPSPCSLFTTIYRYRQG
jgi:hypothetical protein